MESAAKFMIGLIFLERQVIQLLLHYFCLPKPFILILANVDTNEIYLQWCWSVLKNNMA